MSLGLTKKLGLDKPTPSMHSLNRNNSSAMRYGKNSDGSVEACVKDFILSNPAKFEEILDNFRNDNHEFEMRLGSFVGDKFNSRVQGERIHHVLQTILRYTTADDIQTNVVQIKQDPSDRSTSYRRIVVNDGEPTYDRKVKKDNIDLKECDVRFSSALEFPSSEQEFNSIRSEITTRKRVRYTFIYHSVIDRKLDISEYSDYIDATHSMKTYEAECEFYFEEENKKMTYFVTLNDLVYHISQMCIVFGIVTYWEKCKLKDMVENLRVSPAQPIPLLLSTFMHHELSPIHNYAVTIKIDGMRKLLMFIGGKVYMIIGRLTKPSIERMSESIIIGTYQDASLDGTVLEAEYYSYNSEHNDFSSFIYIFDVVSHGYDSSIRSQHLDKRINTAEKIIENISAIKPFTISVKTFWFVDEEGSFYEVCKKVFDSIESNFSNVVETDGLIFQHKGVYTEYNSPHKPYKWKPINQITNDFKYELVSDESSNRERFNIKCLTSDRGLVPFIYDGRSYFAERVRDPKSVSLNGMIVESTFDSVREVFVPHKIRYDKPVPNTLDVCASNFKSIAIPVTENCLVGKSCAIMRKFHNNKKSNVINEYIKGVVLDIGSGQGGDLDKWAHNSNRISSITVVEPSQVQLLNLQARAKKFPGLKLNYVQEKYQDIAEQRHMYDTVFSFYSMTFFYESRTVFNKFVHNLLTGIKHGGTFAFSVLNGNMIKGSLGDLKSKGWEIKYIGGGDDQGYGNKIVTTVAESRVVDVEEYVFDVDAFERLLVPKYFDKIKVLSLNDDTSLLSPQVNEFSRLNTIRIYRRNTTEYVDTFNEAVQTFYEGGMIATKFDDVDDEFEEDVDENDDVPPSTPHQQLLEEAGGVGNGVDEGVGEEGDEPRQLEEVEETERYRRREDNDIRVNLSTPPDEGQLVEIVYRFGDGDNDTIPFTAVGVDVGNLNIIHAVQKTGVTTSSVNSIFSGILALAQKEFMTLDGGMLAGAYESKVLETRYGGYDFVEGSGSVNEVLKAYRATMNDANVRPEGITVRVKNSEVTVPGLQRDALTEFMAYLQTRYLGERSAAELLSKYLKANIFIVDIESFDFDWSKKIFLSGWNVRNIYSPICGRARRSDLENIRGSKLPTIVLFSMNNVTYFPLTKVYTSDDEGDNDALLYYLYNIAFPEQREETEIPQPLKKNLVQIRRQFTRENKSPLQDFFTVPVYDDKEEEIGTTQIIRPHIGYGTFPRTNGGLSNKALKYAGQLGEIYVTKGTFEIRMQHDHKKLIVGEDLSMNNVFFVNTYNGAAPPLEELPVVPGYLEDESRDRNTAIIEALMLENLVEGNRLVEKAIGVGERYSTYHIRKPVAHLIKRWRDLKITPEERDVRGNLVQVGDTLDELVAKNPYLFKFRFNALHNKSVKSVKPAPTPSPPFRSPHPPITPPARQQPIGVAEFETGVRSREDQLKRVMTKRLAEFSQTHKAFVPSKIDPIGWVYPENESQLNGKWARLSMMAIIDDHKNTGAWWEAVKPDIEKLEDDGIIYTHPFMYDIHDVKGITDFMTSVREYFSARAAM